METAPSAEPLPTKCVKTLEGHKEPVLVVKFNSEHIYRTHMPE